MIPHWGVLGFAFAALTLAQVPSRSGNGVYDFGGPAIALPEGVQVKKEPGPDFDVYRFSLPNGRIILGTYIGYHPNTAGVPNSAKAQPTNFGGFECNSWRWRDERGGACRQALISRDLRGGHLMIHIWYDGLSASDAALADRMISSLRPGADLVPAMRKSGAATNRTDPLMPSLTGYKSWKLVNPKPYFVPDRISALCAQLGPIQKNSSPHGGKYIRVFANSVGEPRILAKRVTAYPVGTVLVKEKFADKRCETPEMATVMIKRARGYNPAGGDWEYAVVNDLGEMIMECGRLSKCQGCHVARKGQDFVFRTYRPGAPKDAWKEGSLLPPISH
jgi:hypothetical protein